MKVTLQFNGHLNDFLDAIGSMDDNFNFIDNVAYAIDYCARGDKSYHNTEYGSIEIMVED